VTAGASAFVVVGLVTFALVGVTTPGAAGTASGPASASGASTSKIVLRGRQGIQGPWRRYLWLKLHRFGITSFTVCAVRNVKFLSPSCRPPGGGRLPQGSILKLEQGRPGRGWRTVAISREAALQAVLSNTLTGNRLGPTSFRVTLRNVAGRVLETSNVFRVYWTR
jgi:hypothetical protein